MINHFSKLSHYLATFPEREKVVRKAWKFEDEWRKMLCSSGNLLGILWARGDEPSTILVKGAIGVTSLTTSRNLLTWKVYSISSMTEHATYLNRNHRNQLTRTLA